LKQNGHFESVLSISRTDRGVQAWKPGLTRVFKLVTNLCRTRGVV